ncbi:hypothetical protein, partial [Staphylococcus aureus]|uniref:hypothetical protein n=1 Tax=Staphylococcus aureus TaxID=1280 RepID=UPI001C409203
TLSQQPRQLRMPPIINRNQITVISIIRKSLDCVSFPYLIATTKAIANATDNKPKSDNGNFNHS